MHKRYIRTLPYPKTSYFTHEDVARIKVIPDEEIPFTSAEVEWMKRAVENLDYMIAQLALAGEDTEELVGLRGHYQKILSAEVLRA